MVFHTGTFRSGFGRRLEEKWNFSVRNIFMNNNDDDEDVGVYIIMPILIDFSN